MSQTYLVISALLILISFCEGKSVEGTTYPIFAQNLINLGGVNGKFFFYENTTIANWDAARKICADSGLILAEVKTEEEVAFLNTKANTGQFDGWYWVGGRDAKNHDQFVWDNSEEKFSSTLNLGSIIDPLTCLFIYINPTDPIVSGAFYSAACSRDDRINTLCQTI